mmetsp:Transcript_17652/g.37086  ORF Transcript_17652/g.37086 Transcript_17652/m.37086 type:complete len:249 (-) Transcript_17652:606-1352(-)
MRNQRLRPHWPPRLPLRLLRPAPRSGPRQRPFLLRIGRLPPPIRLRPRHVGQTRGSPRRRQRLHGRRKIGHLFARRRFQECRLEGEGGGHGHGVHGQVSDVCGSPAVLRRVRRQEGGGLGAREGIGRAERGFGVQSPVVEGGADLGDECQLHYQLSGARRQGRQRELWDQTRVHHDHSRRHGHADFGGHAQHEEIGFASRQVGHAQLVSHLYRVGYCDRGDLSGAQGEVEWACRESSTVECIFDGLRV